jgi:Fe-S-cluster-containing hydrogenase component 2
MRLGKTEKTSMPDGILALRRRMIDLEQVLLIHKDRCCGCRDCEKICPVEAVSCSEPLLDGGTVSKGINVDVKADACIFCGQCAVICPTKAIDWKENDATVPSVVTGGILPALDEKIEIRDQECRTDCELACQLICPAKALQVKTGLEEGKEKVVAVLVDREHCFYCGKCRQVCPYGLISVKSARLGLISFSPGRCPPSCRACTEVCPTGAIYLEAGRVVLNEGACIYCQACSAVCRVPEALEVKRERIQGLPLRSQLWVDVQGKLVSPRARIRIIRENAASKRERAFRTRMD